MSPDPFSPDPFRDVIDEGKDTFSPGIDALVREIQELGGWGSPLSRAWLREIQAKLWSLGDGYRPLSAAERASLRARLLANLEGFLGAVRDDLKR